MLNNLAVFAATVPAVTPTDLGLGLDTVMGAMNSYFATAGPYLVIFIGVAAVAWGVFWGLSKVFGAVSGRS